MILQCCFALFIALAQPDHHKFGLKEAQPRIDNTIRVCTYNVLNLFDHTNDPTLEGEFDDMGNNPGPTSIERCKELAKAINRFEFRRDITVRIKKMKDTTGMRNRSIGVFKRDEWTYNKCKEIYKLAESIVKNQSVWSKNDALLQSQLSNFVRPVLSISWLGSYSSRFA